MRTSERCENDVWIQYPVYSSDPMGSSYYVSEYQYLSEAVVGYIHGKACMHVSTGLAVAMYHVSDTGLAANMHENSLENGTTSGGPLHPQACMES